MSKTNIFKKGLVFLIVLISALTLVACKGKETQTPYGNLGDTVYMNSGGYKVTEKDLYKEMKLSASGELETMIYEILFKEELNQVNAYLALAESTGKLSDDDETLKEDFLNMANEAIFGSSDIKLLEELDEKSLEKIIYRFVDSAFFRGLDIEASDIDTVDFENHALKIFKHYALDIAKKVYAREQIQEDIKDEDSSAYIDKDEDIKNYFETSIKKRYPLSAVNIRFTNKFEADETLRHFNIKVYRSQWYILPDPRVDVVEGYALSVLEDVLKGEDISEHNGSLTESNHKLYYEKYTIDPKRSPSGENEHLEIERRLELDEVLQKFFEIYNSVYPYREEINIALTLDAVLADEHLVNDDEDNLGLFTKGYDDFVGSQSSLRTYIYNTLSTDEDGTRYTATPRSYGNYYFLSFKLKDHNEDLLLQVDEDDKFITWTDDDKTELQDYALEYYNEMIEKNITSTYINKKAGERFEEATVEFYDELLLLNINQSLTEEFKLAKKFNNDLIAVVNDTEITVDAFYAKIEKLMGPNIALELGLRHHLQNSEYMDKIDKEMLAEYRENVEQVLTQFGQGMFEGSGFPASIGRKKFLQLAFRSESIEEAVERIYVNGELERLYTEDLELHYGEEIYEHFADYANRLRKQYFSITTSHLLIYVDIDEDDSPDKPEEFFQYLEDNGKADQIDVYKDLIVELMRKIHEETRRYSTFTNGLQAIVSEYDKSTKILPNLDLGDGKLEWGPEHEWAKFKKAGLVVKFESLGASENSTNYPTSSGSLDQAFFDRLHYLYDEVKLEDNLGTNFPKQVLDDIPTEYDDILETVFGWHLILVTAAKEAHSAKFTEKDDKKANDDDEFKIYEHIIVKDRDDNEVILSAYNNEDVEGEQAYDVDQITANQVRIYMYEKDSEYGLESIPSSIKSALSSYLDPVISKYNGDTMKMYLITKYFLATDVTFTNSENLNKINRVVLINQNQFLEYTNIYETDGLFYDIYGDWFDTFN